MLDVKITPESVWSHATSELVHKSRLWIIIIVLPTSCDMIFETSCWITLFFFSIFKGWVWMQRPSLGGVWWICTWSHDRLDCTYGWEMPMTDLHHIHLMNTHLFGPLYTFTWLPFFFASFRFLGRQKGEDSDSWDIRQCGPSDRRGAAAVWEHWIWPGRILPRCWCATATARHQGEHLLSTICIAQKCLFSKLPLLSCSCYLWEFVPPPPPFFFKFLQEQILMHRWRYPSLSLHGIEGAFSETGAKTVIPRKVIGKFSIRLVPDMDPKVVEKQVGIVIL